MVYIYDKLPDLVPDTANKNAAVFTCAYNEREQRPGNILFCDTAASTLTGFPMQKIFSGTFIDLCHSFPILNPDEFNKSIHFRNEINTLAGPPLLCDFFITAIYSLDTTLLHIKVHPVSFGMSQPTLKNDIIPSNKLDTLDLLSHGISHSINNSINLVTLSADLLRELFDDLISSFNSSFDITIRGMSIPDLSKMVYQLTENLLKSSSKINLVSQALVHFLREIETAPESIYDVRKILQTAVILTEHEINKSSYEFIYEPPQGIIKRTGNQHEILQAVFNCILFLCKCTPEKKGRFRIFSSINHEHNSFNIHIQHNGAALSRSNIELVTLLNQPVASQYKEHPLSVAKSLISTNSGDLEVSQPESGGVNISISFATVSSCF